MANTSSMHRKVDRIQTLGPHPEEAALFARPSRRMAAGTISLVAVLRDARARARAPQDEVNGRYRYDSHHENAVLGMTPVHQKHELRIPEELQSPYYHFCPYLPNRLCRPHISGVGSKARTSRRAHATAATLRPRCLIQLIERSKA